MNIILCHTGSRRRLTALCGALVLALVIPCGCSQLTDPNVPEPLRPRVEPVHGGDYLLYRPSRYERRFTWPLIVACHGGVGDSANRRIRAWTQLAEQYGFLVIAPTLEGAGGWFAAKPEEQRTLQRRDEERILAAISHVRAGHSVSEDRIFIHGWSGGAHTALFTGLRHPELFRAVALSQPKFDEAFIADVAGVIDHHQPVYVNYSIEDAITGKHGKRCVDWLRSQHANLSDDTIGPVTQLDTERPIAFFRDTVRKTPWLVIDAEPSPGGSPLEVRLTLRASFEPQKCAWRFGDASQGIGADTVHAYEQSGAYDVEVTVDGPDGAPLTRRVRLTMPEMVLSRAGS